MAILPAEKKAPILESRRRTPWVLVAALAFKAAIFIWLGSFGLPLGWGDMVFFKQPAYMALHTGVFTLPTAIGYRPYADVIYGAYPPLYTYLSLLFFKVFGFGVHASLGFDLAVHMLLTSLLGWVLWRKTGSQLIAALFVLLSTGFLLPEGRPDELAALLVFLAMIAVVHRRYVLTALALGLSLATQPTQAILGLLLCIGIDLVISGVTVRVVLRAAGITLAASALCILLWLPSVAQHLPEAITQFRAHSSDRWSLNLIELLSRERLWTGFWLFVVAFVGICGAILLIRPPAALARGSRERAWLLGILLASPLCIGFLLYLGSPYYGYRLLNYLYLAMALYLVWILLTTRGRWVQQATAWAALIAIILLTAPLNLAIGRFALAPLTWDENAVTYQEAINTVREMVPVNATVGGDSTIWWAIVDGRPFYSLSWYRGDPWPDYLISTAFWGKDGQPAVLQRQTWKDRIKAEYHEVTSPPTLSGTCELQVFGRALPLSRSGSSCDWRVRIWERNSE